MTCMKRGAWRGGACSFVRRMFLCLLSALVVASLCAPVTSSAYADVRSADSLCGITVGDRGLSAALCPSADAEAAVLVNDSGRVFFERNADERHHIASVTKIMTAIVALEYAPLDTKVVVTDEAARIGESSAGLAAGDAMTLEAALNGLLVSSGNDAAIAIGDTLGALMKETGSTRPIVASDGSVGGSSASSSVPNPDVQAVSFEGMSNIEVFVLAMNEKAAELGMANSLFANPHGLDVGNYEAEMYSTARDVATMSAYAMENETFRSIVAQDGAVLEVTRSDGSPAALELKSTDRLIGIYDGACGIKTGYTQAAGFCFAGACNRGGEYLYAVVLGSTSESQRFDDAKALYEWYYDNWHDYSLANSDTKLSCTLNGEAREVPVVAEVAHKSWLDKTVKATLADPDASLRVFSFDGNISQEVVFGDVKGKVKVGDKVGSISFYQHNEVIATCDMVAAEEVAAPGPLETLKIAWQRLMLGIRGEADCAESVVLNQTPLIYDKTVTAVS